MVPKDPARERMMTEPQTPTPADVPAQEPMVDGKPKADEVDWKAKSREWEKRAKDNKSAADRLAEIEEANKTESQKMTDRLAAAEKQTQDAQREALRFRLASKYQVSDEDADLFLTGADEETLSRQAQRLTDRESERKKQGNRVPKEGANPSSTESEGLETVRALFGG